MLRLLGIVAAIGLADSANPSTVAPALFMATGSRARAQILWFTLGAFASYFLGGVIIALGPGQLVLALVPAPSAHTRALLEVVAGGLLLLAGLALWLLRARLRARRLPAVLPSRRSGFALGATIMAVELPTAFPYFGAIAAVVGSGYGVVRQIVLLLVFNVCFVLPLLAIVAVLWLAGDRGEGWLGAVRGPVGRNWPVMAAFVALVLGVLIVVLGVSGLAASHHPRVST